MVLVLVLVLVWWVRVTSGECIFECTVIVAMVTDPQCLVRCQICMQSRIVSTGVELEVDRQCHALYDGADIGGSELRENVSQRRCVVITARLAVAALRCRDVVASQVRASWLLWQKQHIIIEEASGYILTKSFMRWQASEKI